MVFSFLYYRLQQINTGVRYRYSNGGRMQNWMMWAMAAGLLVILELFTGTFYLLMIALGLGAGMLAALLGAAGPAQAIVAGVVGAGATAVQHRSRFGRRTGPDAARDPSVNLDIGQPVAVPAWQTDTDGRCTSRVQYRGAQWDVEMAAGQACTPGPCTIVEIRGSRLIVAPLH
jgi:membrane protein implicated in regulation of membrane protease activity